MTISRHIDLCLLLLIFAAGACRSKAQDLYGFIPAGTAAVLDVDMKKLGETGPGGRFIASSVPKNDCLLPFVTEKAGRILVGFGDGGAAASRPAAPFMIAECKGCDVKLLSACITRHFGLAFDEKAAVTMGGLRFIPDGSDPTIYVSRLKKSVFFLGLKEDAERVAAAAGGARPSLGGLQKVALPGKAPRQSPVASLIVLKAHEVRKKLVPPESEFSSDLALFDCAAFWMTISGTTIALTGSLFAGKGRETAAPASATSLAEKVQKNAASPLLEKMGVSDLLRKLAIKGGGDGRVEISFSIEEKDLLDFIQSQRGVFDIGL